jgi:hypothetical protein
MDDLNIILSQPISEPDPALKSKSSSDTIACPAAELAPAQRQQRTKQPRTSELFKSIGSESVEVGGATDRTSPSSSSGIFTDHETLSEGHPAATSTVAPPIEAVERAEELASDDDSAGGSQVHWALLVLMSYSSAITLALTWVLWTGRTFQSAETPSSNANPPAMETVPKTTDRHPVVDLPPIPPDNLARLARTMRIGDLEVTPVSVALVPVDLVRSIEPAEWRREESESLVLRLKLTNVSADRTFAPLERAFVRDQASPLDRSAILTSNGRCIKPFPLALESEWLIVGQEFPVLKPGESVETVIGSEAIAEERLTDEMTWHVRLRIGPYRTDVVGVRFNRSNIMPGAR